MEKIIYGPRLTNLPNLSTRIPEGRDFLSSSPTSNHQIRLVGQLINRCVIDSCGACVVLELEGVGCSCLQSVHIPVGPLKVHGSALWNILYRRWLYFVGKKGSLLSFDLVG